MFLFSKYEEIEKKEKKRKKNHSQNLSSPYPSFFPRRKILLQEIRSAETKIPLSKVKIKRQRKYSRITWKRKPRENTSYGKVSWSLELPVMWNIIKVVCFKSDLVEMNGLEDLIHNFESPHKNINIVIVCTYKNGGGVFVFMRNMF